MDHAQNGSIGDQTEFLQRLDETERERTFSLIFFSTLPCAISKRPNLLLTTIHIHVSWGVVYRAGYESAAALRKWNSRERGKLGPAGGVLGGRGGAG